MIGGVWPGKVMALALGAILVVFPGGGVFASTPISSGTGFFVHPDGYILTCRHVIEGAGTIEVVLPDSTRHIAEAGVPRAVFFLPLSFAVQWLIL